MSRVTAIAIVLLLAGCTKDHPKRGKYTGYFASEGPAVSMPITIEEAEDDRLVMNGNTFLISGNRVSGSFAELSSFEHPVSIIGSWRKERRTYYIEGDYTTLDSVAVIQKEPYTKWEPYYTEGFFVIKSE